MTDKELFEVHRLAQQAHSKAQGADHKADTALLEQAAHEKICAERYHNIDKQLTKIETAQSTAAAAAANAIEKIYIVLNELRGSDNIAKGKRSASDHIFRYACLGVTAIVALYGLRHG